MCRKKQPHRFTVRLFCGAFYTIDHLISVPPLNLNTICSLEYIVIDSITAFQSPVSKSVIKCSNKGGFNFISGKMRCLASQSATGAPSVSMITPINFAPVFAVGIPYFRSVCTSKTICNSTHNFCFLFNYLRFLVFTSLVTEKIFIG